MEEILKQLLEGQKQLVEGQKQLFEGQKQLFEGQKQLFEGQKQLFDDQKQIVEKLVSMDERLVKVEKSVSLIENDHGSKLSALLDGYHQNAKILNYHTDQLNRIEDKVTNHDIQISILDKTKSNRRIAKVK